MLHLWHRLVATFAGDTRACEGHFLQGPWGHERSVKVTGFADRKQQNPSPASPRRENGRRVESRGRLPKAKLKNQTGPEVEKLLRSRYHSLMLCLSIRLLVRVKSSISSY